MLLHLTRKRLRLNFLTARFWIGALAFLFLATLCLFSGLQQLKDRQQLYESRRDSDIRQMRSSTIYTYAQVRGVLHRPPEPGSVLAQGLGERFGSVAELRGRYGPPAISSRARENFLLPGLTTTDFVYVSTVVLSLLAVFLTADGVAGERVDGTLELVLSGNVPRWKILLGEYLGTMFTLLAPILTAFAIVGIVLYGAEVGDDLGPLLVLLILILTLVTSAFALLGLLSSAVVQEPATAFVVAFLSWILLAVIYPSSVAGLANEFRPLDTLPFVSASNTLTETVSAHHSSEEAREAKLLEKYRNQNLEQALWIRSLWLVSPFSATLVSGRLAAGTGIDDHRRFLQQVRRADQSLADWQAEKIRQYPSRESHYFASEGPLDLSGLPEASFTPTTVWHKLGALVLPLASLVFWSLFLFFCAHLVFLRYNVRSV